MKTTLTLIVLLMLSVSSQARLGESFEQCEKRYGTPTNKDADKAEVWFEKAGIILMAHFHQGKVDAITLRNASGDEFTMAEINVLAENNLGKEWKTGTPADPEKNELILVSREQTMFGYVRVERRELMFYTPGYRERTEGGKAKEGDAGRRLNGF